jgi:hypothetical protein
MRSKRVTSNYDTVLYIVRRHLCKHKKMIHDTSALDPIGSVSF